MFTNRASLSLEEVSFRWRSSLSSTLFSKKMRTKPPKNMVATKTHTEREKKLFFTHKVPKVLFMQGICYNWFGWKKFRWRKTESERKPGDIMNKWSKMLVRATTAVATTTTIYRKRPRKQEEKTTHTKKTVWYKMYTLFCRFSHSLLLSSLLAYFSREKKNFFQCLPKRSIHRLFGRGWVNCSNRTWSM